MYALLLTVLLAGCDRGENAEVTNPGAAATGEPLAVYTCPMHPDVTQATPGKCPKCGMKLEKRVAPPPGAPPAVDPAAAGNSGG